MKCLSRIAAVAASIAWFAACSSPQPDADVVDAAPQPAADVADVADGGAPTDARAATDTGGSALVGTWSYRDTTDSVAIVDTMTLAANGTVTGSVRIEACTGALDYVGMTWTATGTMVDIAGTPNCSGTLDCNGMTIACGGPGDPGGVAPSNCAYVLSNNAATLTLVNCNGGTNSTTWTRVR
jgi:hypothetical protein